MKDMILEFIKWVAVGTWKIFIIIPLAVFGAYMGLFTECGQSTLTKQFGFTGDIKATVSREIGKGVDLNQYKKDIVDGVISISKPD